MRSEILKTVLAGLLHAAAPLLQAQETGALDMTFDAGLPGQASVSALAVQADGKVILGGGGVTRRLADGSVDPTFHSPPVSRPDQIIILPDGKMLMSGAPGETSVVRTHADGTEDSSFRVGSTDLNPLIGNADVARMAPQADGKVIVAGSQIHIGGSSGIARLNADGSRDSSFNVGAGLAGVRLIGGVAVQTDGKIIVAGDFDSFDGSQHKDIVRLHPDGSLDTSYNPAAGIPELQGEDGFLRGIMDAALGGDGRLVAAVKARTAGVYKDFLVRIMPDGSIDPSFTRTGVSEQGWVHGIAMQADGKILVSGAFSEFGGALRSNFARVMPNGGIDAEFVPAPVPASFGSPQIGVSATGLIYLGGEFFATAEFPRSGAARLFGMIQQPAAPEIFAQPENKTVLFGAEAGFFASGVAYPAPQLQWFLNGRALPGETNRQLLLKAAGFAEAGQYRAVVSNHLGSASTSEATLTILPARSGPGAVDISFMPDEVENVAHVRVHAIAPASQGSLYVARQVHPYPSAGRSTNEIIRLDARGRMDPSYRIMLSEGPSSWFALQAFLLQQDGRLVVLWTDTLLGVPPQQRVLYNFKRFNSDGSEDLDFAPVLNEGGRILDADLQKDGKLLIAGRFADVNGAARTNVARLLPNGSVDMAFDPARAATNLIFQGVILPQVERIQAQEGGRVLVSAFGTMQLNVDGSVDSSFPLLSGHLRARARYSDKSWLIGVSGNLRIGTDEYRVLARADANNQHDPSFVPPVEGSVSAIVLQPDEKALIAGSFEEKQGAKPNSVARLNRDGTLDVSFDVGTGPDGSALIALPAPDGKVWVAGSFTHFDGYRRQSIARLLNNPLLAIAQANGQNLLRAATYSGARYRLETSESIVGEWSLLELIEGNNAVREIVDSAPASGQRFYRLRVE